MSNEYEARGLSEVCVDNEQIAALHTENNRERTVIESLQKDLELLRGQINHDAEIRVKQEAEILEQKAKLSEMHLSHQTEVNQIKQAW